MNKKTTMIIVAVVIAVVAFFVGAQYGKGQTSTTTTRGNLGSFAGG